MSIVQISQENGSNVKEYQCTTADLEASYPSDDDCDAGSMLEIIDTSLKKVVAYKVFDGDYWNEL